MNVRTGFVEQVGASSIEYAILASLIAIAILTVVVTAGESLANLYCSVGNSLPFSDGIDC